LDLTPLQLLPPSDLLLVAPVLIVLTTAITVILADLFMPPSQSSLLPTITVTGLAAAFVTLQGMGVPEAAGGIEIFSQCLKVDRLTVLAQAIILGIAIFLALVSPYYLKDRKIPVGEYYGLGLLATMAMMVLSASNELLTLFINIEMLSFALYVLTGMERQNLRATEAAFKYFLTGSYAGAFLLFGITMIYGATGSTFFPEIALGLESLDGSQPLGQPVFLAAGLAMMMVGIGFKLTLAPFHMYAPDVYAGAPTPVAGAIATGSKVAGFVAFFQFIRIFAEWRGLPENVHVIFYALALTSIVVGNIGALVQQNIKRLLAYSGVAHAGYVLVPIVALLADPGQMAAAEEAIAYYIGAYGLMTALAFGVCATLGSQGEGGLDRFAGLAKRSPLLAAAMGLALLSLTGVPLTVGFVGKFYLFSVAVDAGLHELAVFGVLASVASAYYYLRVIVKMFMEEPATVTESASLEVQNAVALLAASAGVFIFAAFPALMLLR
jgi:NADH-quinone oxidoreductase subunit N